MKKLVLTVIGLGALTAAGFYLFQTTNIKSSPSGTTPQSIEESEPVQIVAQSHATPSARTVTAEPKEIPQIPVNSEVTAETPIASSKSKKITAKLIFDRNIEAMVSPQTSYEERQAALKQLKDSGKLDEAITSLEQRVADNPRSVESVTALGEAYYKKAGQTDDVREQAILAMKADQALEVALNLDPSNWDARFTKAVGMSYWPPQLNKSKEMFEEFQTLIQQQEALPSQPQFARTYVKLGEQYEKAGYPKYAMDVWQRGAAFFPTDKDLRKKLTTQSQ